MQNATQSPNINSSPATVSQNEKHLQEARDFIKEVETLAQRGNSLGANALEEVARHLGASCANKYGRPSEVAFVAFVLAMQHRNLSLNARVQIAQVANKAALAGGEQRKAVFAQKASASSLSGALSYRLNLPASVDCAING